MGYLFLLFFAGISAFFIGAQNGIAILVILGIFTTIVSVVIMTVWREYCEKCQSIFTHSWYYQHFPWTDFHTKCLSCGHEHVVIDPTYALILRAEEARKNRGKPA
ncbi:MAG: hypothetical protein Q8P76_03145 [bacterium]|nr:hypothetical protein [bacterium]